MAEKFNTGQEVRLQIPSARGVMQVKEGTSGSQTFCISDLTVEVQRFHTSAVSLFQCGQQRKCKDAISRIADTG